MYQLLKQALASKRMNRSMAQVLLHEVIGAAEEGYTWAMESVAYLVENHQ